MRANNSLHHALLVDGAAVNTTSADVRPSQSARRNGSDASDKLVTAAFASKSAPARTPPRTDGVDNARRWRVAIAAGIVHALHVSVIYMGPATLLSPMRAELGLTRTQIALPLNVFRLVNCALLVPAGALLDHLGATRVLWPSLMAAAALGALLPLARSLTHLVVLQVAFAATKLMGGLTAMLLVVSAVFAHAPSGAPCAAVLAGWSAAGCIAPAVVGALAARFGWRFAFGALAALFSAIGLPLAHTFLRSPTPSTSAVLRTPVRAGGVPAVQERVLSRRYAATLCMMGSLSVSLHVVFDHLIVYLHEDAGFSFERCTVYMSLLNLLGLTAKLVAGRLSDVFNRASLFASFASVATLGCLVLVNVSPSGELRLATSHNAVLLFVMLYGLGYSGVFTLITTALPEFGRERMGLRSNLNLMFLFGFGSIGSYVAGELRTRYGSYLYSFLLSASMWGLIFICTVVYGFGKRVQKGAIVGSLTQRFALVLPTNAINGTANSATVKLLMTEVLYCQGIQVHNLNDCKKAEGRINVLAMRMIGKSETFLLILIISLTIPARPNTQLYGHPAPPIRAGNTLGVTYRVPTNLSGS
eukprot:IDg1495t1